MVINAESGIFPGSRENVVSPEREKYAIVVASDIEGPHLQQDTAREVFTKFVKPVNRNGSSVDYGGTLFDEIYDWYTFAVHKNGFGEEGSDMALGAALLLGLGVTQEDLNSQAAKSLQTPGSAECIARLHNMGTIIIGVTTAWEEAHRPVTDKIGLDGLRGTRTPIDTLRDEWRSSGNWHGEQVLVDRLLTDCFDLIDNMQAGDINARLRLHERLETFYFNELEISFDPIERKKRGKCNTMLANIIEGMDVVGDQGKARIAQEIFTAHGASNALHVAIGDGLNDCLMLESSPFSIAINGPHAVKTAKVGVITDNVGIVSELIALRYANPGMNIDGFVQLSQRLISSVQEGKAIVHKAGPDVQEKYVIAHREKRVEMRGVGANIP